MICVGLDGINVQGFNAIMKPLINPNLKPDQNLARLPASSLYRPLSRLQIPSPANALLMHDSPQASKLQVSGLWSRTGGQGGVSSLNRDITSHSGTNWRHTCLLAVTSSQLAFSVAQASRKVGLKGD